MAVTVTVPATTRLLTTRAACELRLRLVSGTDAALLDQLIAQVSAAIVQETGREFARETVQETIAGSGTRLLGLTRRPVVSVSQVLENSVAITDWSIEDGEAGALYRQNGWVRGGAGGWDVIAWSSGYLLPGTPLERYVVTYVSGYLLPSEASRTLPQDVEAAAIETVAAWYAAGERDPALEGITVGDVTERYAPPAETRAIPPRARDLLAAYRQVPV